MWEMCIHAWEQVCGVVDVHICGECIYVDIIGVTAFMAPEVET